MRALNYRNKQERVRAIYRNPNSLFNRLRKARAANFTPIIEKIFAEKGAVRILDIGGSPSYWDILGEDYLLARRVRIRLANLYPHACKSDIFENHIGNGCALDLPDNSFDFVHSNSVIEHVGTDPSMAAFAGEVRRLAPSYYVQTPCYWFPYEPHMGVPLVHWLPQWLQARLVYWFQLDAEAPIRDLTAANAYLARNRLLSVRKMQGLFPDAQIRIEYLCGLPKSIMAVRG